MSSTGGRPGDHLQERWILSQLHHQDQRTGLGPQSDPGLSLALARVPKMSTAWILPQDLQRAEGVSWFHTSGLYYGTQSCYWAKLGFSYLRAVKPVYWHLTCVGCGEGKCSIYCKESRQLELRRPDFSSGFQGKVFKDRMREGDAGCGISSWMFFWLVGGEVIGS